MIEVIRQLTIRGKMDGVNEARRALYDIAWRKAMVPALSGLAVSPFTTDNFAKSIRQFVDGLRAGSQSLLSPEERLAAAQSQYNTPPTKQELFSEDEALTLYRSFREGVPVQPDMPALKRLEIVAKEMARFTPLMKDILRGASKGPLYIGGARMRSARILQRRGFIDLSKAEGGWRIAVLTPRGRFAICFGL